jgi:hypothetical protein
MMKNKCSELGCMREAVKKVSEFAAFTLTAPVSATELVRNVCSLCRSYRTFQRTFPARYQSGTVKSLGAVAQLGERSVRNGRGRGFEPHQLHQNLSS